MDMDTCLFLFLSERSELTVFCLFRFNIYTLHQRGMNRSQKSESSYLVTSPGRDLVHHYQPASRRSLAQLANNSRSGSGARKSSTEHFLSWIPRRSRYIIACVAVIRIIIIIMTGPGPAHVQMPNLWKIFNPPPTTME